jgi:alkyl hydroperoxide reductase subunit AhpC
MIERIDWEERRSFMSIRVGEKAPEFTLDGVVKGDFKSVALKDYHGKWLVLFFYPLDFTFV